MKKMRSRSILENGFATVTGAPGDSVGTRSVVERLAPIAKSVYGEIIELGVVGADVEADASDSSYSNIALGCHTDTTYYQEAYGYVVRCCLVIF